MTLSLIEKLNQLLAENNEELAENIDLDDDGRNVIIIVDDNAEDSDSAFLYETHSPAKAYEFLENEGLLNSVNNLDIEETELVNELKIDGEEVKISEVTLESGDFKIEVQIASKNAYFEDLEDAYDYIDENLSITVDEKMSNVFNLIENNYYANGEVAPNTNDTQYATIFFNKNEFLETWEEASDKFETDISKLSYPVIVFDSVGSTGGEVHEYDNDYSYGRNVELIMRDADEYFNKR